MTQEKAIKPLSGWIMLVMWLVIVVAGVIVLRNIAVLVAAAVLSLLVFRGFIAVAPNTARVLLLFGSYVGTVRIAGFYWVNPFNSRTKISLRVRNFETGSRAKPTRTSLPPGVYVPKGDDEEDAVSVPSKVNDRDGNPIEISAVVVWKVVDTAAALFDVHDYSNFVRIQSEAALRNMSARYPYDSHDDELSLRGSTAEVSVELGRDIQERLEESGVEVLEARLSHLAYAPEIASAMLQRQQAQAASSMLVQESSKALSAWLKKQSKSCLLTGSFPWTKNVRRRWCPT